jgi:Zn-finger nucleic acid-binding protein
MPEQENRLSLPQLQETCTMNCPACDHVLSSRRLAGIPVDICHGGCGGLWFDAFELAKVDESHELTDEELLRPKLNLAAQVGDAPKRPCPRCAGVRLRRHFFSPQRQVEIDTCPQCGGVWLDAGELQRIRAEKESLNATEERAQVQCFVELVRQRQAERVR